MLRTPHYYEISSPSSSPEVNFEPDEVSSKELLPRPLVLLPFHRSPFISFVFSSPFSEVPEGGQDDGSFPFIYFRSSVQARSLKNPNAKPRKCSSPLRFWSIEVALSGLAHKQGSPEPCNGGAPAHRGKKPKSGLLLACH